MLMPQFENNCRHFKPITDPNYKGPFKILEYGKDMSVSPDQAQLQYFMSEMNIKRRQVICELNGTTGIICQAGAMQWMYGDIKATTGIKGAGDLMKKAFRGAVTKESKMSCFSQQRTLYKIPSLQDEPFPLQHLETKDYSTAV